MKPLPLPLLSEVYSQLPASLKLLSWHIAPGDESAFAAYLQGKEGKVRVKATRLWFQDYTGVPEIVNLAAKRDALAALGKNPGIISAVIPTHLVFDHSVRTKGTLTENRADELRLNFDRIRVAKWAANAMGIKVVPPNKGVIHQVNLEKLVPVFDEEGRPVFGKGTDSHTPMVNANGILATGIGGSEAQKVIAGERIGMKTPKVIAVNLRRKLRHGINSSDLALYLKKVLRKVGVTNEFVQFIGTGVDHLPLEARATIANVAAEFGCTIALFMIDEETIRFLKLSGRDAGVKELAQAYGIWRTPENEFDVEYTQVVDVDLKKVTRGINGPNTPHNWVPLEEVESHVKAVFADPKNDVKEQTFELEGVQVPNGALLLASLASCTHTANPDSMLKAFLMMKKAAERGLKVKPWVKTATASGSKVLDQYVAALGLTPYLEQMGFPVSAYGCGPCIGQSGGLNEIGKQLLAMGLKPTSIVSANRNYAGRQDANVSISFLGAPDLVFAYALAGRIDIDITTYDLGNGATLAEITPTDLEISEAKRVISAEMHAAAYEDLFKGDAEYEGIETPEGDLYDWPESILVKKPPFFVGITPEPQPVKGLAKARVLGMFGDDFSTDAISPAGEPNEIPAAMDYLRSRGVQSWDFLSIGGYRSNDEMLMATTFANPTNQNKMVTKKGGWTEHGPTGEVLSIFDAAMRYKSEATPLVVIGGKNYGCGSSRVMAASGAWMLGVRAIVAQSFESIHRKNLWQMGVTPLCFQEGESDETFGFDGSEQWDIPLDQITADSKIIVASVTREGGDTVEVNLTVAIDSPQEFEFLRHGGAMQQQLRELAAA